MQDLRTRPNEPTAKSFYEDRYLTEAHVWIDDHGKDEKGRQYLIFSDTIFYPHGGGQKGDRGYIEIPADISEATGLPPSLNITDTRKVGDFIRHILETEVAEDILEDHIIGDRKFKICIDWDFRFTQMRLHTTAHLLHCFLESVLDQKIEFPSYSELMEDFGINRYPIPKLLSPEQLNEVLERQNAWTAGGHDIKIYANDDPNFPEWYRWWECDEYKIPCGGVHPNNTNEVGKIVAGVKSKKGNTSIRFSLA